MQALGNKDETAPRKTQSSEDSDLEAVAEKLSPRYRSVEGETVQEQQPPKGVLSRK